MLGLAATAARSCRLAAQWLLLAALTTGVSAQGGERYANWTRPTFPAAEYATRRAAAVAALGANDLLLVPSGEGTSGGETFRQLDNFEYFTGLEVSRSMLVVDGRSKRSLLFVPQDDPRFTNPGRPNDFPGRPLVGDPALQQLSGVDSIAEFGALAEYLDQAAARGLNARVDLGRPGDVGTVGVTPFTVPSAGDVLVAHLRRAHPALAVANGHPLIASLRMIKSPAEIAVMREAARITSLAIARGAARVRPGADERSLTGGFIADCMELGAQRVAFTPIVKSGDNSLWPWRILGAQYDRRNRVMQSGELVIYDVGCERDHYVSDVGRTFPVAERFTDRQRELVEMVRKVSDAVIAAARPGVTLADLQLVAVAQIPAAAKPYMQAPLFFGHHLGLDTGDPNLPTAPLAAGMIFTIEPWYYNHREKVAVFIEDQILITPNGSENLTASLPRDAAGLELLRQARRLPRP